MMIKVGKIPPKVLKEETPGVLEEETPGVPPMRTKSMTRSPITKHTTWTHDHPQFKGCSDCVLERDWTSTTNMQYSCITPWHNTH
jgi:hypothetical protein